MPDARGVSSTRRTDQPPACQDVRDYRPRVSFDLAQRGRSREPGAVDLLLTIEDSARELASRKQPSRTWNEAESTLAFLLLVYLDPARLGGTKKRVDGSSTQHPAVDLLSEIIGRTTNAVSWKIQNQRYVLSGGAVGAPGGSARDAEVVERYAHHLDLLWGVAELMSAHLPKLPTLLDALGYGDRAAARIEEGTTRVATPATLSITIPERGTSVRRDALARRGQGPFRDRVLANYRRQCAVCELRPATPRAAGLFLRAGHIRPWTDANDHQRLDPANGLSLCVVHDRAFEGGLFTLAENLAVVTAPRARELFEDDASFDRAVGSMRPTIDARRKDFERPGAGYLAFHRDVIFGRAAWPT